jgi:hypothetical protein
MNKFIYYLSMTSIVVAGILILYVFYLTFYPFQIVTLNQFSTDKAVYFPGEDVELTLDFEKHHNFKSEVNFYVANGMTYPLTTTGAQRKVGMTKTKVVKHIPPELHPGTYRIYVDIAYRPISIRPEIIYTWSTNEFVVTQ